jgi:hypothetical protein
MCFVFCLIYILRRIEVENTEFRLNESKFFLGKLKENKEKTLEFEYYLDAYVSSARSVLWIMKSEYSKLNEWNKWYEEKDPNEEQKKLLKGIVDMRNRTLKQRPLKVKKYASIVRLIFSPIYLSKTS